MKVSFISRKSILSFFVFLFIVFGVISVTKANASIFDHIINLFTKNASANAKAINNFLTNDDLLKPNKNILLSDIENTDNLKINNDGTIVAQSGSMRVSTEKEKITDGVISLYEVKEGDTLNSVAKLFDINRNTIIWANSLKSQSIKPGDTLLIFPMVGIEYTVKSGGTLQDIADKYKADITEIAEYNGISVNTKLVKGDVLFIPNVELEIKTENNKTSTKPKIATRKNSIAGYFMMPVSGCVKSQGIHGPYSTAVDIGCKIGTTVIASAEGNVIKAASSGYNGGYGNVIIIAHPNGTQSIYAHLSSVGVEVGQKVKQGQVIGATGNTGRSSGPHLHFETRGTGNPF